MQAKIPPVIKVTHYFILLYVALCLSMMHIAAASHVPMILCSHAFDPSPQYQWSPTLRPNRRIALSLVRPEAVATEQSIGAVVRALPTQTLPIES